MSAFASAVTLRKWERDREFLPWVIVVALVTLAFFLSLIIFFENPFARFWHAAAGSAIRGHVPAGRGAALIMPADGRGLNPLLRHPGMIIHPPMLYLGFVSFVIPFAFAIAALVTGRTDDRWIRITRRWTLVAWLFLSLGLVLGGRWAYDVLGWGGYWGWDPVEIAAFMPWLTGTAFLHSVMIQEKRGMFKRWNMVLIILTYSPGHLRHLPDPLGRAFLGACLCPKRHRPAVLRLYWPDLHHLAGAAAVPLERAEGGRRR